MSKNNQFPVDPIDPDFPPIKVEPWQTREDEHLAHMAWRRSCREVTKQMRAQGPATDKVRTGFFQRGVFIDANVSRADVERAFVPGHR